MIIGDASAQGAAQLRSEETIIQRYLAPLAAGFPGALGLQDDCAFAAPSPGHEFVFKTDAIAAGVHFLPDDPPADIGWKALAVNVSDLAAKGARPICYLMSLAFPSAPTQAWMTEFARGLGEAQTAFGIHLMGGDTDRRPGPLSITPMVVGEVPAGRMVRRATARAGDVICVTGTLGDAALGLRLRQEPGLAQRWGLDAPQVGSLIGRFLRPLPRLGMSAALLAHAQASMDVSDGLMKDLGRMCRASGVGAIVQHSLLPRSDAFRTVHESDVAVAETALFAGDDYEVLSAVPLERLAEFIASARSAGISVTEIGRFTSRLDAVVCDAGGNPISVGVTGWDHF